MKTVDQLTPQELAALVRQTRAALAGAPVDGEWTPAQRERVRAVLDRARLA